MSITFDLGTTNNEITVHSGTLTEVYSLTKVPSYDSILVAEAKQLLLGRLNTTVLFKNLSTCADLFGIAYNAVNGMEGLQSAIWKLRQDLIVASSDSADDYVNGFINRINKVPNYFNVGVKSLLSTPMNAEKSCKAFELITKEAEVICKEAKELVVVFKNLTDNASDIAQKVINAKALDITKRKELEENVASLKAQMEGLTTAQKDLEDEIDELTEQYNKLDKKIDKAADQQFWLSITSAITGAIGVGLSAYSANTTAGMINKVSGNLSSNPNNPTNPQGQSTTAQNTQKSLDTTNEKIAESETKINNLQKQIEAKNTAINAETDETKKAALLAEKKTLTDQQDLEKSNLATLKAQAKSYTEIITGIGAGLSNLSDKLDKQGNQLADSITALTQMADNIATKKSALNKEKREILQKIAEYTKTVENSVVTKNSLDLAIAALSAGIGAMNYIVSVLNDFYTFWTRIKSYCENLASSEIESYFFLNEDDPDALKSIDFLSTIATNACQWVALKLVLIEYQNAFHNVRDQLQIQLKEDEDPNPEVMWKRAIDRSKGISDLIKIQAEGV